MHIIGPFPSALPLAVSGGHPPQEVLLGIELYPFCSGGCHFAPPGIFLSLDGSIMADRFYNNRQRDELTMRKMRIDG